MRLSIISRVQSRSVQYNKRDVIRALDDLGISWSQPKPGELGAMIIYTAEFPVERRKEVETRLRLVHARISYRVET